MPWNDYPLRSISVPADHTGTEPYIFIGDDDPIALALNEDAAIVFHFGTHNSAFVIGVSDEGTPHDDGHLQIIGTSDEAVVPLSIIDLDYSPFFAGFAVLRFGDIESGVQTNLFGDSVAIKDFSGGVAITSQNNNVAVTAGSNLNIAMAGTININGNPMGWIAGASTLASRPALVAAGEVVQLTALTAAGTNPTFQANSTFRVVISGSVQTSAVGSAPLLGVRKTNIAGQRLLFYRVGPTVAGFPYGMPYVGYFTTGALPVTAPLVLTLGGIAGQTLQVIASADSAATIDVYYDGPASTHPNVPVLV